MNKTCHLTLLNISKALDQVAHLGKHRFIRDKDLGLTYGEHILRQLIALINFDMVFDVGGNIGQYGLQLRRNIGYHGPLLSFEPIPSAANQIRSTAAKYPNWQVRECAVGDTHGRTSFNVMKDNQFSSLLFPNQKFAGRFHGKHAVQEHIDVEVITLEDAVRDAPSFKQGLLKLDTQGTELTILKGGNSVLHLFPCIQLEIGFQPIYEGEENHAESIRQLEQLGYRLCSLFPNNHGHFPHLLEMDAIFIHETLLPELP